MGNEAQNQKGRELAEAMLDAIKEDYNKLLPAGRHRFVETIAKKFSLQMYGQSDPTPSTTAARQILIVK